MGVRQALPAVLAALLLASIRPAPVVGAIKGSPHDVVAQGYHYAGDDPAGALCSPCHLPGSTGGQGAEGRPPPSLGLFTSSDLTCFSCHDGTTIVSPDVDASTTAFNPLSHKATGQRPDSGPDSLDEGGGPSGCALCHLPHDNDYRPFLRRPFGEICMECHGALAEEVPGQEEGYSRHPMGINPLESLRPGVPLSVDRRFRETFPRPYPAGGGKGADGSHWNLGGHLGQGDNGSLVCATCHAVHGNEGYPPSEGLLAVDPVYEIANAFCESCHQGQRGDGKGAPPFPNPGGTATARTYHPCDDDESYESPGAPGVRAPVGWPYGRSRPGVLMCNTCHDVHYGAGGTLLLRRVGDQAVFCEECHVQAPQENHHPLNFTGETKCLQRLAIREGALSRPGLICVDCHRAHNAGLGDDVEARYVPLLRDASVAEGGCLLCHPEGNPTCLETEGNMASHFLGDPTLADTYSDPDPPFRESPWPESGQPSDNGPDGMKVTCFSCHTFRTTAVTSGDDGTRGYLLARSGNPVEWEEESGADLYLCTGCHGVTPKTKGEGLTHPLMSADITRMTMPAPPVSVTPEGRVNCDSCHRPHGAVTAGGYYILEEATGESTDPMTIHPLIKFDVLCYKCHSTDEY